jgi:hypothetical protein
VRAADSADLNFGENESFSYMLWLNYDPSLAVSGWRIIFIKCRMQDGGGTAYNSDAPYVFRFNPDGNDGTIVGAPIFVDVPAGYVRHPAFAHLYASY